MGVGGAVVVGVGLGVEVAVGVGVDVGVAVAVGVGVGVGVEVGVGVAVSVAVGVAVGVGVAPPSPQAASNKVAAIIAATRPCQVLIRRPENINPLLPTRVQPLAALWCRSGLGKLNANT